MEIEADLSDLSAETRHVMSLINPARTYMVCEACLVTLVFSYLYVERSMGDLNSLCRPRPS